MRRSFLSVLAGMLIGATMLGGGAYAAASGILAERSPHPVAVNGQPVEIEAYLIEGHNYYQLQDLGELLGFDVVWTGRPVRFGSPPRTRRLRKAQLGRCSCLQTGAGISPRQGMSSAVMMGQIIPSPM